MIQIFILMQTNWKKIEKVVNTELRKVNRWLILNKLALNVEKSNFVLFYTKPPSRNLKIKIGNKRLNEEDHVKFLGVEYWLALPSAGSLIS